MTNLVRILIFLYKKACMAFAGVVFCLPLNLPSYLPHLILQTCFEFFFKFKSRFHSWGQVILNVRAAFHNFQFLTGYFFNLFFTVSSSHLFTRWSVVISANWLSIYFGTYVTRGNQFRWYLIKLVCSLTFIIRFVRCIFLIEFFKFSSASVRHSYLWNKPAHQLRKYIVLRNISFCLFLKF